MTIRAEQLPAANVRPGWTLRVTKTTRGDVPEASQSQDPATGPAEARAEERDLVAACLAGHHAAFNRIVERHRRTIYHLCYRFVGNHEDASDLSQDVFLRAYRGLRNFKGDSSLATWLHRIAVNVCLNRVSARKPPFESIDEAQHVDHASEDPAGELLRAERAGRVRAAIARLPPKQRATLLLRVYRELPHEEIARILGSSVGAVKANFFHALGNLRRLLDGEPI